MVMKDEQGSAPSIRRERGDRDGEREEQWLWVAVVMFHCFCLVGREPCWAQTITDRSKDAHHMGGDVKT